MMVGGTEHIVVLAVILLDGAGDHVQFGSTDNESEVSVDFQPADNLVSGSAGGTAEVVICLLYTSKEYQNEVGTHERTYYSV